MPEKNSIRCEKTNNPMKKKRAWIRGLRMERPQAQILQILEPTTPRLWKASARLETQQISAEDGNLTLPVQRKCSLDWKGLLPFSWSETLRELYQLS